MLLKTLLSAGDLNILRVHSHDNAIGRCLEGLSESEKQGSYVLHFLDTDQSSPMLLSYIFIDTSILYHLYELYVEFECQIYKELYFFLEM